MGNEDSLESLFKEVVGDVDIGTSTATKSTGNDKSNSVSEKQAVMGLPTEMSCSQVFDQLLKCYSLGGQTRHYYRYGEISYCKDKRAKLKFCMTTKIKPEAERKDMIRQWYQLQLEKNAAQGHSSEAVWKSRHEPLRRPFREDAELYINDDSN